MSERLEAVSTLPSRPRQRPRPAGIVLDIEPFDSVASQWVVARAEVGRSIVMRRFHARGRGRAARVEKWFSHLKIVVAERAQEKEGTA